MRCRDCPHYKCTLNYNRCDIAEMEFFFELENCDLVNDDGSVNYNSDYFKDIENLDN